MTSPTTPLENALVLCLEAIERILQAEAPDLRFSSAEFGPATGEAHTFAISGVGDGILAIGATEHPALKALIGAKGEALAAAVAGDLSAALDRPITLRPTGNTPETVADLAPGVVATLEGLEEPSTLWLAVDASIGATIGALVDERLQSLSAAPEPTEEAPATPAGHTEVLTAEYPQMGPTGIGGEHHDLSLLSDVQLNITVELGRTTMRVRDLLDLGTGSVIELDRSAGTPVDVLVNGTIVARGEVVVVDDELGVRVTEVMRQDAGALT